LTGVLSGLRVIEGSAFVAAPTCGMTLAQLGADVIRFDMIGGGIDYKRWPVTAEGNSIYWAGLNKGKRSIAVDFRKPEGQEILSALITQPGEDRGILLTNFPMKGWLSYETLRAKREDLIALNILGNPDGSVAVDYTVNAAVGFPYVTGPGAETQPVNQVFPGWDVSTGYAAATGILGAERHRRLTGEGQYVSLSLADMAFATVGNLGYIGEVQINGTSRPHIDNDVYGSYGRDFTTKDGRQVMVIAVSVPQWKKLVKATDTAEAMLKLEAETGLDFTKEEDRYAARDAIAVPLTAGAQDTHWTKYVPLLMPTMCAGGLTRPSVRWLPMIPVPRPRTHCSQRSTSRGSAPTSHRALPTSLAPLSGNIRALRCWANTRMKSCPANSD